MRRSCSAKWQKKKRREIEALQDGVLLPANQDAETTQMLEETIAREKKADQRLLQETRRAMLKVGVLHRLVDWPSMRNLTAWSDDPNVRDKLTEQGITTTSDKTQARLFVVESLDNPGERIQWMVALHGGWLMTSKQVLTGRGAFVKYTSATSKRRDVYISRAFHQQHAQIAKIVVDLTFHLWSLGIYKRWTGQREGLRLGPALIAAIAEPFSFQLLRHAGAVYGWYAFLTGSQTWTRQTRTALEHQA